MAVNVSAWVWTLEIPPYEKLVMLELADHADTKGFCFPKQATIAKRCRISRGAVNRILKRLEAQGLVTQTQVYKGGHQRASEYRLSLGTTIYLSDPALHSRVTESYTAESPSVTPIETSLETSLETSVTAAPENQSDLKQKTETNVKLEDVDLNPKKSKDEIFDRFKMTPKGCGDLWKDCHAASGEHGKCVLPNNTSSSVLKNCAAKLEDDTDFRKVVWGVMHDWVGFGKHCESHDGSPGYPLNPRIDFFAAHLEAAVNFTKAVHVPVKSIAKPLTNKPASSKPTHKVNPKEENITLAEVLAMNKDYT